MFIILLCLVHVANSDISVQTESNNLTAPNNITPNTKDVDKIPVMITTEVNNDTKNTNAPTTNITEKQNPQSTHKNAEIIISFNENTTTLINELKETVEKLLSHLETARSKSKSKDTPHRRVGLYDVFPSLFRKKRTVENTTDITTNSNIIPVLIQMDRVSPVENATKAPEQTVNITKHRENRNETDTGYDWLNSDSNNIDSKEKSQGKDDNKTVTASGRRSFSSDMEIAKLVRTRLLSYVHEHITDTMNKIVSLKNIKNAYERNNMFNVGYIMANIDLIEVNLKKLKDSIDKNNQEWAEEHILDVFDKVKYTNSVVTSLKTALRSILNYFSTNGLNGNVESNMLNTYG